MKGFVPWMVAVSIFAVTGSAVAGGTCAEVLANNSYDCTATGESDIQFTFCMDFTTPGVFDEVDIVASVSGGSVYSGSCSCLAKGSVASPKFDQSSAFDCVAQDSGSYASFSGKAAHGVIKKGQITAYNSNSSIYTCVQRDTACP